jgi:aminoglycoside phosphotransferase (APT) family kinase protein
VQPDPHHFVAAIRREISRPDLFNARLDSGATAVTLMRMAEGVAQLGVRLGALPGLLAAIRPRYVALLEDIAKHVASLRDELEPAIAQGRAIATEGEEEVRLHDRVSEALAAAVRALGDGHVEDISDRDFVLRAAALEHERRSAINDALTAWRGNNAAEENLQQPPLTEAAITEFLRSALPGMPNVRACNLRPLSGFNAKEIFFLEIEHADKWPEASVLRREPPLNATATSLFAERPLIDHLVANGLPVPRVLTAGEELGGVPGGFIISERVDGAPRTAAALGDQALPVMAEIAHLLARIHHVPPLPSWERSDARTLVRARVQFFYDLWRARSQEDALVMETAYRWLISNLDRIGEQAGLVHGDFSMRNILQFEGHVAWILDWELSHASRAAEDLAYFRSDAEQVMPWEDFLALYAKHVPEVPDASEIDYFDVLSNFWRVAVGSTLSSGFVRGTHDNFIHASCAFFELKDDADRLMALVSADGIREK